MTSTSRKLYILEGPDGGGKSSMAKQFIAQGFHYVHSGTYKQVKKNLARLYVEAMAPALLGLADVVMDRCWMSEPIYGAVFRDGASRLDVAAMRMLERVAARCETRVFACVPPLERCLTTFRARRSDEYLEQEEQLAEVWQLYHDLVKQDRLTSLPTEHIDYTSMKTQTMKMPTRAHPLAARSAGFLDAPVVLVGESFADQRDADPLYRAPFVAFDRGGCSAWLADQLTKADVPERALLWINADDAAIEEVIKAAPRKAVFALGQTAFERISPYSFEDAFVFGYLHPQHAKRFHARRTYALVAHVKETLR